MCKEEIYINMNISFLVSEFLIFVCGIQLYGENYEFKIWSEKGKGTKIEIIIPIERGSNYVESSSSR